ncbi:MAG: hypothetical protein LBS34_01965 [Rickettsiales bacterium]|nr:hypothetical protein [Rickettsiales bacterium]
MGFVKIFVIVYLLMSQIAVLFAGNNTLISLKDVEKINRNLKYDRLINIKNGKIETDSSPKKIFLFGGEKYYTNISYNGQIRKIGSTNKKFLEGWLSAKYFTNNSLNSGNVDTNIALLNSQIDLFYRELTVYSDGKLHNFIVQKPLADKLEGEVLKNSTIQVEFIYLGKSILSDDNFFVITNYSKSTIARSIVTENDFIVAKTMIGNEQYDAAIMRLESFLKIHPNHLEARKNLCLARYLKGLRIINSPKTKTDVISCYEELAKIYDNEIVYYTLASLYYSDDSLRQTEKQNNILKYTNKALDLLQNKKIDDSLMAIYHGTLYLRGITKLKMNDEAGGLADLKITQDERPDLINIDLFIKNRI